MKLSKLLVITAAGLLLTSCGEKKKEKAKREPIKEVTREKIDSISTSIGVVFSPQIMMIKNRLKSTNGKLNEKAYLKGLSTAIDENEILFATKHDDLLKKFSEQQNALMAKKEKSKDVVISEDASLKHPMDSISYVLGAKFGNEILKATKELEKDLAFKINKENLKAGYKEGSKANIKELSNLRQINNKIISKFQAERTKEVYKNNKLDGQDFLAENKEKDGVKTTKSGLQYTVIKEGKGDKPKSTSTVTVHYHGTMLDGTVFDSSVERKQPATFALNGVIKGWTEGLQLMTPGSKYKFFIPQELAYGASKQDKINPFSTLIFEVELIEVK